METNKISEGYVTVNGVKLHFLDWGGSGEPILIVHATGFLARVYDPIARVLTEVGHVLGYDQRGHGDSGLAPDDTYNWWVNLSDLRGFLDAMGFRSIRGFGHSAGATLLGCLASSDPGRISRAVLVDPAVHDKSDLELLKQRSRSLLEITLKRRRLFSSVEDAVTHLGNKPPFDTWDRDVLKLYCQFGTRETHDGQRELKCLPEVEAKIYATAPEFDGLDQLVKARSPLLVILTRQAHEFRPSAVKRLKSELANARILDLKNDSHFVPMEKPGEIAQIARDFLSEI